MSFPPQITLSCSFDSSRAFFLSGDSIKARSPLSISFSASSSGGEDGTEAVPVSLVHYRNGALVQQRPNISEIDLFLSDSGEHLLSFESTDIQGISAEKKVIVGIYPAAPAMILSFTSNRDTVFSINPAEVVFTAEVLDSHNVLKSLVYKFSPINAVQHEIQGGSGIIVSDTLRYQFPGSIQGKHEIILYAVDILGRKDSMSIELVFDRAGGNGNGTPPTIYRVWASACTASVSQLIDFGINAEDRDGEITGYEWSFGDNYSAYIREPSHRFMNPGLYVVKVTVNDDSGCQVTDSIYINVNSSPNSPPCIRSLVLQPDSGASPLQVTFTATAEDSDGTIDKYIWKFGDGFETWTRHPQYVYTYKQPGVYQVKLLVRDNRWAFDSISDTVRVSGLWSQEPELMAFPNPAYEGKEVHFWFYPGNLSFDSQDSIRFTWFIQGRSINTQQPDLRYTFDSPGEYTVKIRLEGKIEEYFEMSIIVLQDQQ